MVRLPWRKPAAPTAPQAVVSVATAADPAEVEAIAARLRRTRQPAVIAVASWADAADVEARRARAELEAEAEVAPPVKRQAAPKRRPATAGGNGYLLLGLVAGAVTAAAGALLLTPRSGANLRQTLIGAGGAPPLLDLEPALPTAITPEGSDALAQVLQYEAGAGL